MRAPLLALLALAVLLTACGNPEIDRPKEDFLPDPDATPPPAPLVQSYPSATPYPIATIRGTAPDARRIIIEAGAITLAELVLPDGTFCVDVPLSELGNHEVLVWAQSTDGAVSASPATVPVLRDPTAPVDDTPSLCSGSDPADCAQPKAEICDNGLDDDCNGLDDGGDPACRDCADDLLEPNDEASAPRIDPGMYADLSVCSRNPDYYAIALDRYDDLTVRLRFDHAMGDVDLKLYDTDRETILERSLSVTDDEEITYRALVPGIYLIQVYGFVDAENAYEMEILVD